MEALGVAATDSTLQNVLSKQALNRKKILDIKKQIEILEGAHTASMKSVESDRTYTYYISERDRVNRKRDIDSATFDSKIATYEAKKRAFIEEIDSKIEKVERDKKAFEDKLDVELERYSGEMARIRTKYEDSTPTSQSYRKAQEALRVAEREEKELIDEFSEAMRVHQVATTKQLLRAQREQEAKRREIAALEEAKRQEEIKAIEARRAQERKEDEEKAKKRTEQARALRASQPVPETPKAEPPPQTPKAQPPPKATKKKLQLSFPLFATKRYSIQQLDELQDRYIEEQKEMTAAEEDMFSRCWAYAERLEERPQWFANRYNHIGEKKDGDIIPEDEFKKMFG